jgi:DNA polymerase III epsilon subunit-like protein
MYLFFDTETNGLPKNWKAPVENLINWPRLVQIAWILADESGQVLEEKECIIKPEGFTIPKQASAVHGISTEKALDEGQDLSEILQLFANKLSDTQFLVAHNINFDEKIVGAELLRKKLETDFFKKETMCTMQSSTKHCNIPGPYGPKWPKLSELHINLFGEDFEGAHDALADIQATHRCFFEMRKLKLI